MPPDPRWTAQDLAGTAAAPVWWDLLVAGLDPLPDDLAAARARVSALAAVAGGPGEVADRAATGTALVRELSAAAPRVGGGAPRVAGRGPQGADPGGRHRLAGRGRRSPGRTPPPRAGVAGGVPVVERGHRPAGGRGHPIFPGAAGENVTVGGVDRAATGTALVRELSAAPGPVAVGDAVEVEPQLDRAVTPRR